MNKVKDDMALQTIETTIGDLICAIQDAAQEACIEDCDVSAVTQAILIDILRRTENATA